MDARREDESRRAARDCLFTRLLRGFVASFLTHPLPSTLPILRNASQVLRVPWFEWRDDLSREEKAEYLAHLLYRDAGPTLKDAAWSRGGVLMSRRTEGDDAPRSTETRKSASSAGNAPHPPRPRA